MTRLFTCGFETNDLNEAGASTIGSSQSLTVVNSSPTPRNGAGYCLKAATTGTAGGTATYKVFTFAAAKTEVWVRFGLYAHPNNAVEYCFAVMQDSAAGNQTSLTWDASTNMLRLRLGFSVGGTLLGTSPLTLAPDGWHLIEWRTQITSTTVGVSEVWMDGAQVISFSGDNTATANANVQGLVLGLMQPAVVGGGIFFAFDDIAVNDTSGTLNNGQIGDGRVVLLKPSGAGSNTNQTRGGTDSGANWSQLDELPPSLTDYVYSATPGTRDTYALEDLPSGTWAVNCVEVLAYAQNSDALAGSLGLTIKSGSTTNEGAAITLTPSAAYVRQLYETDPNTSAAWTNAAVNALEAGTTVR